MTKAKPNSLAAFIVAHAGDPAPQAELLRDAGFEELAEALESGKLVLQSVISDKDARLLFADAECDRLQGEGIKPDLVEVARRFGLTLAALRQFRRGKSRASRRLAHVSLP